MLARDLAQLGVGFNLGNRVDTRTNSIDFDGSVKRAIDDFRGKGFGHVRIPVTWIPPSGKCKLASDPYFVQQLTKAVKYAVTLGLRVIVDAHHEGWLRDHFDGSAALETRLKQLWTDVSRLFADVGDDSLIFQILNEPGSNFDVDETRLVNRWGYDAVRAVMKTRCVLVQGNDMGSCYGGKAVYPTASSLPGGGADPRVAVSVHCYGPPEFALENGTDDVFPDAAAVTASVEKRMKEMRKWMTKSAGMSALVWDEFGVGRKDDAQSSRGDSRVQAFYYETARQCLLQGWPCTVWCDQSWFGVRRESGEFVYGLADALIQGKRDADAATAAAKRKRRR